MRGLRGTRLCAGRPKWGFPDRDLTCILKHKLLVTSSNALVSSSEKGFHAISVVMCQDLVHGGLQISEGRCSATGLVGQKIEFASKGRRKARSRPARKCFDESPGGCVGQTGKRGHCNYLVCGCLL